jgi:hypothetical protein
MKRLRTEENQQQGFEASMERSRLRTIGEEQVEKALKVEQRKVGICIVVRGSMTVLGPKNQEALVLGIAQVAGVSTSAISITGVTAVHRPSSSDADHSSDKSGRFGFYPTNSNVGVDGGGAGARVGAVKIELQLVGSATELAIATFFHFQRDDEAHFLTMLQQKLKGMRDPPCPLMLESVSVHPGSSDGFSRPSTNEDSTRAARAASRHADKVEEAEVKKDETVLWVLVGSRQSRTLAYLIIAAVLVVLMAMRIFPGVADLLNRLIDLIGGTAGSTGKGGPTPEGAHLQGGSYHQPVGIVGGAMPSTGQYAAIMPMPHGHTVNGGRGHAQHHHQLMAERARGYKFGVSVEDLDGCFYEDGRERPAAGLRHSIQPPPAYYATGDAHRPQLPPPQLLQQGTATHCVYGVPVSESSGLVQPQRRQQQMRSVVFDEDGDPLVLVSGGAMRRRSGTGLPANGV